MSEPTSRPGSPPTPPPEAALLTAYTAWIRGDANDFPKPLGKAFRDAKPDTNVHLLAWAGREIRTRLGLERQIRELMQVNHDLLGQLETVTAPPRPVARLIRVDHELRSAWVATSTSVHLEVGLEHEVDPETLTPGDDVVLTPDRTCVLRSLPEGARSCGSVRLLRLEGWLPRAESISRGLKAARALDNDQPVVVWVPPRLEPELESRMSARKGSTSVLVDEFSLVIGIEDTDEIDPMIAAERFVIPLDAIDERDIRGLAREKAQVRSAVERVRTLGAFVLCEGPPGSGKTWLARWARHLLEQTADAVVLGLPPSRDHRYYGQQEADIHELCRIAERLVQAGKLVLVFLDEVDAHFYKSLYGHSVHTNSARATWLSLLGGGIDQRGILFYATTNKADHLPDEFLNRVTHPMSFDALARADARAIVAMHLAQLSVESRELDPILDALVDMIYDETPATVVAEVKLRNQEVTVLYPKDFRQLSARFFVELARDIVQDLTLDPSSAVPGVDHAVAIATARLTALVRSMRLTAANVADRTFVEFDVRNPCEDVQLVEPAFAMERQVLRYTPLEI